MIKRVMKAAYIEPHQFHMIKFPVWGGYKIDGFRCTVAEVARTSRMNHFPNKHVHNQLKGLLPEAVLLDGEIVVGKRRGEGVLGRTSSGVTSEDGEPDWRLWVFDAPRQGMGQTDRLKLARSHVKALDHPRIRFLKHVLIHDMEELLAFIDEALEMGFEGVVLKSVDGYYKEGKSTLRQGLWYKVKPFETQEARITGFFEEMENTNEAIKDKTGKSKRSSAKAGKRGKGTLGGFIGHDLQTGVLIRCGGGLSKAQRKDFWKRRYELMGQVFTYKKQKVGEKDKPRHNSFVTLRPEWDIDNPETKS